MTSKTTRVPLALMDVGGSETTRSWCCTVTTSHRRAAAKRMAHTLSEAVGERIGLRADGCGFGQTEDATLIRIGTKTAKG